MIIPFNKEKPKEACCSFCKKPKSQVKALVESTLTGKTICDKCLEICRERLRE